MPLDLVRDAGTHHRRDLGEVDAVVDDHVELEHEPAVDLAHADTAVALRPGEKTQRAAPAGLVDDAERLLDRPAGDRRRSRPSSS